MYWNCNCCSTVRRDGWSSAAAAAAGDDDDSGPLGCVRCVGGNLTYCDVSKKQRPRIQGVIGEMIS